MSKRMSNEEYERLKLRRNFINQNIDGVEYIKSLLKVKKVGNIYTALCPFHNEKTESLRIYPEGFKGEDGKPQDHTSWYCFGCKKGGDIVRFEELYYNLDTASDACDSLQHKFNIEFEGDNRFNALKMALNEANNEVEKTMTLQEINFVCSIALRNYLRFVLENHVDKFDEQYEYVQSIFKKLDRELKQRNAKEAKILINITENTIKKQKELLTDC